MKIKTFFLISYCYTATSLCTSALAQTPSVKSSVRKSPRQKVSFVSPPSGSESRTSTKESARKSAAGETVSGHLSTKFQPEKEVWFVNNITRFIRTNDQILQSDLAERGFIPSPEGLIQNEVAGTKWTLQNGGFAQVAQGSPLRSEIMIASELFSSGSKERSSLLVRENGGLLQQIFNPEVTRTDRVATGNRVQTGWVQHPDLFGGIPAPIYSDEYVDRTVVVKPASRTDKEIKPRVPKTPFALPPNLDTGSVIPFDLLGEPDVSVRWTVSRIYKLKGITYADGKLTSTDSTVLVSGLMTLPLETGIVQHLEAKVQYARTDNFVRPVASWILSLSIDRVTQAQYKGAKQLEWDRYNSIGSTNARWSKPIALSRLVNTERTIGKSNWQVSLLEGQKFTAKSGDNTVEGIWEISNRQIGLTSTGTRWTRLFDFSLASNTIKPADVDPTNIAESPQIASNLDDSTLWDLVGERVEPGKYHANIAEKPAMLTLETGEQEGAYSGAFGFNGHLDTVMGYQNDRDFIGAFYGPYQKLSFLYATGGKGSLDVDLVSLNPQGNWESNSKPYQFLMDGGAKIEGRKLDVKSASSFRSLLGTFKNTAKEDSEASRLTLEEAGEGRVTGSLDFGEVSKTHLRLTGFRSQDGGILGIGEGNESQGTTFFHAVIYKNTLFLDFIIAVPDGDNFLISDKTRFVYSIK